LNPRTLHVSPQYHVVFDDTFSTVPFLRSGEIPPHWKEMVLNNCESVTNEKFELANIWATEDGTDTVDDDENDISWARALSFVRLSCEMLKEPLDPAGANPVGANGDHLEEPTDQEGASTAPDPSLSMPTMPNIDNITLRRSSRKRKPSRRALGLLTTMAVTLFAQIRAHSSALELLTLRRRWHICHLRTNILMGHLITFTLLPF
jgi:hypothetical protein